MEKILNGKLVSAGLVPYADTLTPGPLFPHSTLGISKTQSMPAPAASMHSARPPSSGAFCSLSLQLVNRQVLLRSPSAEISLLSPIPHVTFRPSCHTRAIAYSLLTILLTQVSPSHISPPYQWFSVWSPDLQHQPHLGTC